MPHIEPKPIVALPYVDRAPDPIERPDQRRIQWIMNGECLGAAESTIDNGGEMNRGPVQVQKNATTLYENEKIINESLAEVITRVNAHDDTLGQIGDDNLAKKVEELELAVEPLPAGILKNTQDIFLNTQEINSNKAKIGTRNVLDKTDRDVMSDQFYIKTELGNWTGQDINGNPDATITQPSGIKGRIISQGLAINQNKRDIDQLKQDWIDSDVGKLQADIDQMRSELGKTEDYPKPNVYTWINTSEAKHNQYDADIERLKVVVGDTSGTGKTIDERLKEHDTEISTNTQGLVDANQKILNINTLIGDTTLPTTMAYNINENTVKITQLQTIVGVDNTSGLQAQVINISAEIGDDATPNCIKNRLVTLEQSGVGMQQSIATLQTQVGNSTTGEETGLYKRVADVEAATKISEAPTDGKSYIRKDGAWNELSNARARGGFHVKGNTETTTIAGLGDEPHIVVGDDKVTQYDFNNLMAYDTTQNGLIYSGDGGAVVLKAKFSITGMSVETTVKIYKNNEEIASVVLPKPGIPTEVVVCEFDEPFSIRKNDQIHFVVTSAAQTITFTDSKVYAFDI